MRRPFWSREKKGELMDVFAAALAPGMYTAK
jgi:hypothetical protein